MVAPLRYADVKEALVPGSFLHDYTLWAGRQTDAPLPFQAASALAILSSLAPPDLCVRPGRGVPVYAPLWPILVAKSGIGRKSTCVRLATRIIRAVNPNLLGHQPDSAEGLVEALAEQPTMTLVYSEFGEFLAKTQPGMRQEGQRILQTALYDCQPYQRRLAKSTTIVEKPRLTIFGGVSTPYLERFTSDQDFTGGYLSRMFFTVAVSEHVVNMQDEEAEDDELFTSLVLRARRIAGRAVISPSGFTPEARKLLGLWADAKDVQARAADTSEWLRGALTRAQEIVCKVALLNALAEGRALDIPWTIGVEDVRVGVVMAEASVNSMIWIVDNLCASPYQRQRQALLDMLVSGPLSKPAIARKLKIQKRQLDHLIASVEAENIIVPMPPNMNGVVYYTRRNMEEALDFEDQTKMGRSLDEATNVVPIRAGGER